MQALSLSTSLTFSPFSFFLSPVCFLLLPLSLHFHSFTLDPTYFFYSLLLYNMEMCFANGEVCLMSSIFQ